MMMIQAAPARLGRWWGMLVAGCAVLAAPLAGLGQEWTRFRGPNGSGISQASTIPVRWSPNEIDWKVELPGPGHAHPVLWGERIFLTAASAKGDVRYVLCLSAGDGRLLWKKEYPLGGHHKHKFNSFASSTPAVDAELVFVAFNTFEAYEVLALDHAGTERWRVNLGPVVCQHSLGTSPVIFEETVVIGNEQDEMGTSYLVALDRRTGQERWRSPRKSVLVAYSTPCVYEPPGQPPQLIFNSRAHGVSAVAARTGKPVWEAPLLTMRSVSSPVLVAGILTGSCGSGGGGNYLIAVRPGGQGDVSGTHLAYKLDGSSTMPYCPTPVASGDLMFIVSDKGFASCIEGGSGKILWQQRIGGTYFGSPIRVQDRIYCMSAEGECVVLAARKEFELLARNPLGEGSHSTPAVAGGRMYLRTYQHLISVGGRTTPLVGSSGN